uniref:Uncharacterized protein n=1 Tax=Brassica oleracea var. oleracea TaxID=109376 RepID=A0A0D3BKD9_BRAOL
MKEEEISEVDHAKAVAEAFGKSSNSKKASSTMEVDDVAAGMKELDMDNYDEEDDGIELFSSGRGCNGPVPGPMFSLDHYEWRMPRMHYRRRNTREYAQRRHYDMEGNLVLPMLPDPEEQYKEFPFKYPHEQTVRHKTRVDNALSITPVGRGGSGRYSGDLYYPSNELDPYPNDAADDDDDEDDIDDTTIKPTDSVIICARNEDEVSHLEVYVYEESSDGSPNMYVHHRIIIPEFPLCTAWMDCPLKGGEKGNFVSIGSKETPTIEIWDLDVKYKEGSHTDSVLGLAWNKEFRNILASGSADNKVKVWDMATGTCKITMEHHTKEFCMAHRFKRLLGIIMLQVLLSGSFDQTVVLKDGRQPSHSGFKWSVMSDVESLAWDPHCEHSFVVSLEDGTVKGFDIRAAHSGSDSDLKPSFTIQAHDQDKGVSSISYNISAPNLLATGSMDKTVKLWELSNNEPSCIASHKPKAGAVFSISFSADNPFLLAIGGSKGELHVWDTLLDANVSRKYGSKQS